jgi:hypothetical protein
MSPRIKKLYSFPMDPALAAGLKAVKKRDGISEAEQIRRGIRLWLEAAGVKVKAERPRAVTRKRSSPTTR